MLMNKAIQLCAVAAVVVLWGSTEAHPTSISQKLCGRKLSDFMSKVCDAYNSPSWDSVPIVVEQPGAVRKKREIDGIADRCCLKGCTIAELTEYCSSVIIYTESPESPDYLETRTQKRSTEHKATLPGGPPAEITPESSRELVTPTQREVGRRSRGYGRARRRRCGCRGRRRASLMGTTNILKKIVERAPPVVGTVSPVLQWPRTINTDQPPSPPDHGIYYSAIYSQPH